VCLLQVIVHVLCFAFFNVVAGAVAMIPILLYGLGLAHQGWRAIDVALFGAMLAATDAVAVSAILKAGGWCCFATWHMACLHSHPT
jgi:NhaP-type Na+/H+ or K+/H+ antiporter